MTAITTTHAIPAVLLAAVAPAMAKKDVRYYLNGARLEADPDNSARCTATDGHAALTAVDRDAHYSGPAVTLPRDFVEAINKVAKGRGLVELSIRAWEQKEGSTTATRHDLWAKVGTVTLTAQDVGGRYPDWQAIMPCGPYTGTAAVDASIVEVPVKAAKAIKSALEVRKTPAVRLLSRDENSAVAVVFDLDPKLSLKVAGVVMPVRPFTSVDPAATWALSYAMPRAPAAEQREAA